MGANLNDEWSRRAFLGGFCSSAAALAAGVSENTMAGNVHEARGLVARAGSGPGQRAGWRLPLRYALNTSTIHGQRLKVEEEIELAAKAGYDGIEFWLRELELYLERGGKLDQLRKRLTDCGLTVESAIDFPTWLVDDERQRKQGIERLKRSMEMVCQLGGCRIAAPPAGVASRADFDLLRGAERYREVLELGRQLSVVPQLEIWGSARTLGRLGQAAFVAVEADHPDACLLLDIYHIYRSGSGFHGLGMISGVAMHVIHLNDYPGDKPRDQLTDADRVYPGDGVAPWPLIFQTLAKVGFCGTLSLELFNRQYWKQDPLTVARTGLAKMKRVVEIGYADERS